MYDNIASGPNATAYVPKQLMAGETPQIASKSETVESGQVLQQFQPVARETSSGKLVAFNPAGADGTNKAVGITAYAVDATGGDVQAAIYFSGNFNTDALVWGAATDAQKARAFDGSMIVHRKLV